MIIRASLILAVCIFLCASASGAPNPGGAVAVVALDQNSDNDVLIIDRAVRGWMDSNPGVNHVDLKVPASGQSPEDMEEMLEKARTFYRAGLDAYDMMNYEMSHMHIDRAIEYFEKTDLSDSLNELLNAYFIRSISFYFQGHPTRARNQLVEMFSLKRDFLPDSDRVTPDIQNLIDDARRRADEAFPTTLEIQTEPVPALISVNGRYRGISPIELDDLLPGYHYVTASAPGFATVSDRHLAAPGQIARISMESTKEGRELRSLLDALRTAAAGGRPSEKAASITKWAKADYLLVLGLRQRNNDVTVTAWRFANDGHLMNHGETRLSRNNIESGSLTELNRFLENMHGSEFPRGTGGTPVPEIRSPFHVDITMDNKTWGIVSGSTGAVFLIGGLYFGLSARSKAADAGKIPQLDVEEYQAAMKSARNSALAADALFLGATAGLGLGLYLFIRDTPRSKKSARAGNGINADFQISPGHVILVMEW